MTRLDQQTYAQLSRRWHFLKFEDIGADTEEKIAARLTEILAIEQELKDRTAEAACEAGIYEPHGFIR